MDSANWAKNANRFHDIASMTGPPNGAYGQPAALDSNAALIRRPRAIWTLTRVSSGPPSAARHWLGARTISTIDWAAIRTLAICHVMRSENPMPKSIGDSSAFIAVTMPDVT